MLQTLMALFSSSPAPTQLPTLTDKCLIYVPAIENSTSHETICTARPAAGKLIETSGDQLTVDCYAFFHQRGRCHLEYEGQDCRSAPEREAGAVRHDLAVGV